MYVGICLFVITCMHVCAHVCGRVCGAHIIPQDTCLTVANLPGHFLEVPPGDGGQHESFLCIPVISVCLSSRFNSPLQVVVFSG